MNNEPDWSVDVHSLFRQLFENAIEGIMLTDHTGTIKLINYAFTAITCYSWDDAVGATPRILKSGHHDSRFYQDLWSSILKTGQWQGEIWNRRKDGRLYLQWTTISAIRDEQGSPVCFSAIFADITERKKDEQKLFADLELAKQIQTKVMSIPLRNDSIEIHGMYSPSQRLGGDLYKWYHIDQDQYGVILLDVMGHGIASALISMSVHSLLRGIITRCVDPVNVILELNKQVKEMYHHHEGHLPFF